MTEDRPSKRRLDLAELRRLVQLMESSDLTEVEIEDEGKRVRVVRRGPASPNAAAVVHAAPIGAPVLAPAAVGAAPASEPAAAKAARGIEIPSPMVGTFYRSPSPDAAPYVEVGDRIGKDTPVCIVEAMKVMNEIKAEVEGEILEILVQNGEPVEFGQPLFLVRPSGAAA